MGKNSMNIANKFPNKPKLWIKYKQFQIIPNFIWICPILPNEFDKHSDRNSNFRPNWFTNGQHQIYSIKLKSTKNSQFWR